MIFHLSHLQQLSGSNEAVSEYNVGGSWKRIYARTMAKVST